MTRRRLIIVGAGGHGRVLADTAESAGYEVVSFADDRLMGRRVQDIEVMGAEPTVVAAAAVRLGASVIVAIGRNRVRRDFQVALQGLRVEIATLFHPSAVVSRRAQVGPGCAVLAQAHVAVDAVLGAGVIVNHGARVDHDVRLGDFVHLSPGVHTGGEVTIGDGAHLAVGVSVRNRVNIGGWSVVGVGAAVVADLPENVIAWGVPARVHRSRDDQKDERA